MTSTLIEDLPRWLRVLELSTDPEWQEKRRAGIEALAEQLSHADIESLVRLALKSKQGPAAEVVGRLRQAFKATDETFPSSGNDRELQVLSGATLGELFRRTGDVACIAALAVNTATCFGVNRPELPLDLAEATEEAIHRKAEFSRRRRDLTKLSAASFPRSEFEKVTKKFQAQPDLNNVVPTLTLLIDASKVAFDGLQKQFSDGLTEVSRLVAIQDEELDMLWWLVGERSIDLDRAFAKLAREERPLVIAKELAKMTLYLPGPTAIKSLLARSGLKDADKLTVPACINACDSRWLGTLVDEVEPSAVTRPLHLAIKRKIETSEEVAWVAGWAAATGIGAEHKFSALQIGTQFYRERLLSMWVRT